MTHLTFMTHLTYMTHVTYLTRFTYLTHLTYMTYMTRFISLRSKSNTLHFNHDPISPSKFPFRLFIDNL